MRELIGRLVSFLKRSSRDRELDDELSSHLQLAIDENMSQGLSESEARRRAVTPAARGEHRR